MPSVHFGYTSHFIICSFSILVSTTFSPQVIECHYPQASTAFSPGANTSSPQSSTTFFPQAIKYVFLFTINKYLGFLSILFRVRAWDILRQFFCFNLQSTMHDFTCHPYFVNITLIIHSSFSTLKIHVLRDGVLPRAGVNSGCFTVYSTDKSQLLRACKQVFHEIIVFGTEKCAAVVSRS